jgi:hypothetical protein
MSQGQLFGLMDYWNLMDNYRTCNKVKTNHHAIQKNPLFALFLLACSIGISTLAGIFVARFADSVLEKKIAIIIPLLIVGIFVALAFGRVVLIYILSFCWFVPAVFAGINFIPIATGITAWELLLWLTILLAFVTGDIPWVRSSPRHPNGHSPSTISIWIGLGMVSLFSILAIGRVVPEGVGQFRYAALNIISLFLVVRYLVVSEKQLKYFVSWFLTGVVGLIVFQIGIGGFAFLSGRLSVNMISLTGVAMQVLPNRLALLASSGAPVVLCFALWNQSGRLLRVVATMIYLSLLIIVILTVSRAQMISILIASIIVIVLMLRLNKKTIIGLLVILGITLILLWYQVFPYIFQISGSEGISNIFNRFSSFGHLFAGDNTLSIRVSLIKISLDLLQPFGMGYGRIAQLTGMWEHNLFLSILNGSGLLGVLGIVIFFISYAVASILSLKNHNSFIWLMCVGALASIATLLINGLSIEIIYPTYPESSLIAVAIGFAAVNLAQGEKHWR